VGGYLFLNDSTPGGIQEYAIVRVPAQPDQPWLQIESITFGWMTFEKGLRYIHNILSGRYDDSDSSFVVSPSLQTPEEHVRCGLCM